jgi:hypothetical protein
VNKSSHISQRSSMVRNFFFHWLYSSLLVPGLCFQFHDHITDCRTPWMSDQLVVRPLPKHRTTKTQNKDIHTPNIQALSEIRTHDPSVRASEDSGRRYANYISRNTNSGNSFGTWSLCLWVERDMKPRIVSVMFL